jgi:type IV pilus assembly protein PilE
MTMKMIDPSNRRASALQRGFTLIELMIVVAIVAIIGAFAYPSYQESVAKSRRADAQRALIEAEQYMRRYYGAQDTFMGTYLPAGLAVSPREGSGPTAYNIQLIENGAVVGTSATDLTTEGTTFTLQATRTGSMINDRCGDLQLTNTGKKSIKGLDGKTDEELKELRQDCFKVS